MDAVAGDPRGAGKATIYRRWDSKLDLVDRLVQPAWSAAASPVPNTGSFGRRPYREFLLAFRDVSCPARQGKRPRPWSANYRTSQKLANAFPQELPTLTTRRPCEEYLERAATRGELTQDAPQAMVVENWPAPPLIYRLMLTGESRWTGCS